MTRLIAVALLMILPCAASAQQRVLPIGVRAGVYMPVNSTAKDNFGSTWTSFGISPIYLGRPEEWRFSYDIGHYRNSTSTGSARLIPVTFGATKSLSSTDSSTTYVAVHAGPSFSSVSSQTLGISSSKTGMNANATFGVTFGDRFFLEARYDHFGKIGGVNFDGFSLKAGTRLFDIRF